MEAGRKDEGEKLEDRTGAKTVRGRELENRETGANVVDVMMLGRWGAEERGASVALNNQA